LFVVVVVVVVVIIDSQNNFGYGLAKDCKLVVHRHFGYKLAIHSQNDPTIARR
jgi:hypothetical protein